MWEDVWLLEEHGSRTRNFSFFLHRSARTFLILPLLLQRSLWWEASPKAACLTPVSHIHLPPGQFYSDSPTAPLAQRTANCDHPSNASLPPGFLVAAKDLSSLQCFKSHGHLVLLLSPKTLHPAPSILLLFLLP